MTADPSGVQEGEALEGAARSNTLVKSPPATGMIPIRAFRDKAASPSSPGRFTSLVLAVSGVVPMANGWWLFEDAECRIAHCPSVSFAGWKAGLEEAGRKFMQPAGGGAGAPAMPGMDMK